MFRSKNECNIIYKCTVRLLEDSDVLECEFQPHHKGKYLVDYVCEQLGIKEKDYFGLRYVDASKQRHWLDLAKSILKQIKEMDPILFSFRVKFYPADPFRLYGNGRILLYQQLKRDLRHGRLYCSTGEAAALGALIVQEEIGDYDHELHNGDYVSSLRLALRQTDQLEKKVIELHQKREPGQPPTTAMEEFMGIARGLETYGIDPHPVKDHRGTQLYLGINHCGINAFVSGRRAQHFRWSEVHKLNYEGKMFIAHLSYTDASREPKKHTIGFKCPSGAACRYVWRCAIEQMLFFTLPNSQNASVVSGGGFFSWGTKFKYTGRTEREILTESINALREQKLTNSSTPSKRKANSVPATPSSPQGDLAQIRKILRNTYINGYQYQYINYNLSGYSSLPRSTMSEPLGNCMITTDHLGNIIYNHDGHHIITTNNTIGGCILEPVTEEAKLLRASNIDNSISNNQDIMSDYYFRDSFEHSSTESGLTNSYHLNHHQQQQQSHNQQQQYNKHGNLLYPNQKHQHSGNTTITSINNNNNNNSNNNNNILNNNITGGGGISSQSSVVIRQQNAANNAKIVRKFRLLHAFIPSFIFVVIVMIFLAIIIIESESEIFLKIKNLPEMLSLKYHYYLPIKEYIYKKFGIKIS